MHDGTIESLIYIKRTRGPERRDKIPNERPIGLIRLNSAKFFIC
jgi:hypothetical protein